MDAGQSEIFKNLLTISVFNVLSSKRLVSLDLLGGLNKFGSKLCILNMCSSKSKTEEQHF